VVGTAISLRDHEAGAGGGAPGLLRSRDDSAPPVLAWLAGRARLVVRASWAAARLPTPQQQRERAFTVAPAAASLRSRRIQAAATPAATLGRTAVAPSGVSSLRSGGASLPSGAFRQAQEPRPEPAALAGALRLAGTLRLAAALAAALRR
jgi:hypothetical protein